MTQQTRQRIEVALLAIAFGAGGGWAAFQWQLNALAADMREVKARVAAMYCAGLPADKQPGCR